MSMKFLVVGVGGLAKEISDLVTALGHEVTAYYTETASEVLHPLQGIRIVTDLRTAEYDAGVIAIGDTRTRMRFFEMLKDRLAFPALVHPSACVSPSAQIGAGVLVMQNVVVNAEAQVGEGALLNVASCVAHDCRVGRHAHVAPCVQMGGGSSVGEGVFCGTSSVVIPNVNVGDWSVLGAGTVVTNDVPEHSLAVGVPARVVKSL